MAAFDAVAGADRASVTLDPKQPAGIKAGALFCRLVAGLVMMVGAHARIKAQLRVQATAYNPSGHNLFKFARISDEAIAARLGLSHPGFMEPDAAYREVQQHQIATPKVIQGASRSTLELFPNAMRARGYR